MDDVFQAIDELEQSVDNSKGGFLGKRLINEDEFYTRLHKLRAQLKGWQEREKRDISQRAHSLTREERRALAGSLLRD